MKQHWVTRAFCHYLFRLTVVTAQLLLLLLLLILLPRETVADETVVHPLPTVNAAEGGPTAARAHSESDVLIPVTMIA